MKVITAPEKMVYDPESIYCFLAGGISDCPNWQQQVIDYIRNTTDGNDYYNNLVLLNPRRSTLNVNVKDIDPKEQIIWEYETIRQCDIFSLYFCGETESAQPICLFELGAYVIDHRLSGGIPYRLVSVQKGYSRSVDVQYQLECDRGLIDTSHLLKQVENPKQHAMRILDKYKLIMQVRKEREELNENRRAKF